MLVSVLRHPVDAECPVVCEPGTLSNPHRVKRGQGRQRIWGWVQNEHSNTLAGRWPLAAGRWPQLREGFDAPVQAAPLDIQLGGSRWKCFTGRVSID
jgi:hypothetical protein